MSTGRVLPNGRILRYTMEERVVHWLAALGYIYALLTGLAFYSPRLYWIAIVLGGGPTARAWHPWAGVIFALATVAMYRAWAPDMRINKLDRAWNKALRHYVRHEDDRLPPVGRYNAGQKYLFWLMLWGALLLLVSGVAMWFTESIPWSLRWIRYVAVLVHVIAALITIGGFIIHVYMGTAVVRGGFTAVIRGEVSQRWARVHHPLWLDEITRK